MAQPVKSGVYGPLVACYDAGMDTYETKHSFQVAAEREARIAEQAKEFAGRQDAAAVRIAALEEERDGLREAGKGLAESLRLLRAENDAIRASVITPEVLSGASLWRKRFEDLDREFPARVELATAKLRRKLEKKKALISDLKGRIRNLLSQPS